MVRYKTGEMYTPISTSFDSLKGELLLELYDEEVKGCSDWDKHYRKMEFVGVEDYEKFKKERAAFLKIPKRGTIKIKTKPVKSKIPKGMMLQKQLTKKGGQMHFKNGGGKKKPKALSTKKTNKKVFRKKKGSDNLMAFGVKLPSVKTLEDIMR